MAATKNPLRLPAGIWMLGLVSLFMDASSELIHSLLPLFLVGTLGASAAALGWIEGLAEGFASVIKFFSGAWSDFLGRRKFLVVLGYGLAAASKPLFPFAHSVTTVLIARLIDRTGKGIRGAPRDALITELADPSQRGAAFGLRQSMDTVGAVAGPLLAVGLMALLAGNIRAVFLFATIPALLAVLMLLLFVKEPARPKRVAATRPRLRWAELKKFPRAFWWVMAVTVPFTLARFSEAFLLLRSQSAGLAEQWVPLTLALMSVVYAVTAYPAGWLSDRMPRTQLLMLGCVVLIAADVCLAYGSLPWVFAGTALWGLHMGLSEGLVAALVSDTAPAALVGTGFGLLHLQRGVLLLAASGLAGALWQSAGPAATFIAGAAFGALSVAVLLFVPGKKS